VNRYILILFFVALVSFKAGELSESLSPENSVTHYADTGEAFFYDGALYTVKELAPTAAGDKTK
jgi:hypothetical protein